MAQYVGKNYVPSINTSIASPDPVWYGDQPYKIKAGIQDHKAWVEIEPDNPEFAQKLIDQIERKGTIFVTIDNRGQRRWIPG